MKTYILSVKNDRNTKKIQVMADSITEAKKMVCKAEGCPESAIKKVDTYEQMYNVIKVFKVSARKEYIERNLTRDEAMRVVNRYPDSNRSMVVFSKGKLVKI